jgi:transcription initiation factor TFIIB
MLLDTTMGEMFCGSCGLVLRERIEEEGPEWRAFSKEEEEDRSRAGSPLSLAIHDMGLSTIIAPYDRDASGRGLSSPMRAAMERLRLWDSRSQVRESIDRNLRQAFHELDRLADKLGISEAVIDKAAYIYRKAAERGLVRGRSIPAMVAACLYAACRATLTPRTLKDIAAVSGLKKKEAARCYRLILKEMDIKMPVSDPVICVSRVAAKAGLSERTKRRAIELLRKAVELRATAGKDPMGMAAAALYMACVLEGEPKTQRDVAEAAGVTEVTIRNRYKNLRALMNI